MKSVINWTEWKEKKEHFTADTISCDALGSSLYLESTLLICHHDDICISGHV